MKKQTTLGFQVEIGGNLHSVNDTKSHVLYGNGWRKIKLWVDGYMYIMFRDKIRWIDCNKIIER